ncbi:hypothetical protein CMI47_19160 [Candidatus Pacearchaeota archaeon]|nr:hypothetical protein [Candidatus Pacearchaeota archaeon]|tara:strand:- start:5448 stop:6029 length:582 start_codon:yes stop_codon:yes gene_type:complete
MKHIKITIIGCLAALSIACSSCVPAIATYDDTSDMTYPWDTCSQSIGNHPCDFTLLDQDGKEVSLYSFYGQPIVLDLSAMWCPPCQVAAADVQATHDEYSTNNLAYVTVLIETAAGAEPKPEDCKYWADSYGIVDPRVLAESRDMIDYSSVNGWNLSSWPTFYFINSEMKLVDEMTGYSKPHLDQKIQELVSN